MKNLLVIIMILISGKVLPKTISVLPPGDKEKVERGELVLYEEKVPDATWNKLVYFKMIPVNAKTAMAIFSDFEAHKNFVPNMILSQIVKTHKPWEMDIKFELDLPWPVPNAVYTTKNKIEKMLGNNSTSYKVSWSQVEANSTEKSFGSCSFVHVSDKKSLMIYENFVEPKSIFATFFESKAVSDTTETVKAIFIQIISVAGKGPSEKLSAQISNFEKLLPAKNSY